MKYSVVYSSQTGNIALLAERLKSVIPESNLLYYGSPETATLEADLIFLGFWTDKGNCDKGLSAFMKTIHGKNVFLFGTAGFGGSEEYFSQILSRVGAELDSSNIIIGSYMCQGKMPLSVRQRYEGMAEEQPEKVKPLIENFDRALTHPDDEDLSTFEHKILKHITNKGEIQ